jgi:hypothetical protein
MEYQSKLDSAFDMVAATRIARSTYAPPLYRLLWRTGLFPSPPHFASFGFNFALSTAGFGVLFGAVMLLWECSRHGWTAVVAAVVAAGAVVGGVLFGLTAAGYYRYSARKHRLPLWSQLKAEP